MSTRTPQFSLRTGPLAAVMLSAVVVLGACGNDDDTAPATDSPSLAGSSTTDGADSGQSAAPTSDTDGDRCHTSDLAVTVGDSEGAAGSVYRTLEFTNISGDDCTISGYPGVSLVNGPDGATQVGAAAERESGTPAPVTLTPDGKATAALRMTNPGVYGDRCTPTSAEALKIFPPDERDATVVTVDGLVGCTGEDAPVTLRISPVTPA